MFDSRFFTAAAVVAAYVPSVSSFQPGSDYDVYKTTNLYNCTGHVPVSNVTVPNVFDTLPQIEPSAGCGWEQWTLFLRGTFPMILRWNQGDPSSSAPSPGAQFDLLVDVNGTIIQRTVMGEFSYTNGEDVKGIAIGDNSLVWDSNAVWYNVSVSINGYYLELDSLSSTRDAFHPNVASYNGLLDQSGGWFGSVPLIRGQVVGNLRTPSKNTTISGLSVMRHMFSENPLPSYITKYNGGTVWGYSTDFYDSHVFYQTETTNGTVHEATFLSRALPTPDQQGRFSSAWATYAVTDDSNLYHLSIDAATKAINASFSGCSNTSGVPYLFNVTDSKLFGEFTDLGGGKTSYYILVNGTTTASFGGGVKVGVVAGILEEYQAPLTDGSIQDSRL